MSLGSFHPSLYSDFSSSSPDKDLESLGKSVVASISQMIRETDKITAENSSFYDLGSYLYRAFPVIMELRTSATADLPELLLNLSSNIDLANDLVKSFTGGRSIRDEDDRRIIIQRLESVARNIGNCLGSIPSSAFKNSKCAAIAAKSISRDMIKARFNFDDIITKSEDEKEVSSSDTDIPGPRLVDFSSFDNGIAKSDEKEVSRFDTDIPGPRLVDFITGMHYSSRDGESSFSGRLLEPPYESFFCPLTRKIMEDPVTIETGLTFERAAIEEWLQRFENLNSPIVCPVTGKILGSRVMNKNLALGTMIEEWKLRNEATRIRLASRYLSKNDSERVVLEAMADLQILCWRRENKVAMCHSGVVPLLAEFMEQNNRRIRFEAMETLRLLVEDDEEGQDLAASTNAIATAVRFLSSRHLKEKLSSVAFLHELSKSEKLCINISSVGGVIVMLLAIKNCRSLDASISEKAAETLKNLKKFSENVRIMAENGYLDPLLDDLIQGPEELKTEMLRILGELHLDEDSKTLVAERASGILIAMVCEGNSLAKKAAMKTLVALSSHQPCSQILVNAGLLSTMTGELLTRKIVDESTDARADSADILANLLESGIDPEQIQVGPQGQTMGSDFFIKNICKMILCTPPVALTKSLVKILISLMGQKKLALSTVDAVKKFDCLSTLLEFLSNSQDGLGSVAMELLIKLSPFMGHAIAEKLCKTRSQPQSLLENLQPSQRITKNKELTAMLLSKLPHRNIELNLSLLRAGGAAVILRELRTIQREESRHKNSIFEGLVGSLVRFTATLHEEEVILMAIELNLTAVFSGILKGAAEEEAKRLAALGLERLSSKSPELSHSASPARQRKPKLLPGILKTGKKQSPCRVHGGICSPSATFCLVEAGAVEALLNCVESGDAASEAAMAAICTLLEEPAEGGAAVLAAAGAVGRVLEVVRRRRKEEELLRRCLWFIERVLVHGKAEVRREIADDRALPSVLMGVVSGSDTSMRQAAELVLRRLNKIPDVSTAVVY